MNYIDDITTALTWLGFFAAMFFSYYYYLKFRNQERMKLIEQNVDLSEFYKKKSHGQHFPWFIVGFSLLGIGVGLAVAWLSDLAIEQTITTGHARTEVIIFSSLIIFTALGLIAGRIIEKKKK